MDTSLYSFWLAYTYLYTPITPPEMLSFDCLKGIQDYEIKIEMLSQDLKSN